MEWGTAQDVQGSEGTMQAEEEKEMDICMGSSFAAFVESNQAQHACSERRHSYHEAHQYRHLFLLVFYPPGIFLGPSLSDGVSYLGG